MVSFIETSVTVVGAKKVADKKTKGHISSVVLDYRYRYIPVLHVTVIVSHHLSPLRNVGVLCNFRCPKDRSPLSTYAFTNDKKKKVRVLPVI